MKKLLLALWGLLFLSLPIFAQAPDTLWTRTFGGGNNEGCLCVQQTTDEGYILAGTTESYGAGSLDYYLVKIDSCGDSVWAGAYGNSYPNMCYCVQQTTDGGYILAGSSMSSPPFFSYYVVRTDSNGDTLWTQVYGGNSSDNGKYVQQTADGGYIIAGYTSSFGAGGNDCYLVKSNSTGVAQWTNTYGGSSNDYCSCVQQTAEGGYIAVGYTNSFGAGGYDVYLVKTDSIGDTLWTRTYGGNGDDRGMSVRQTNDEGYILVGHTYSYGAGGSDIYLVKTNSIGDTLWTCIYGGSSDELGDDVKQTDDGGYIIVGSTESYGAGGWDVYVLKTDSLGNPLWTRNYGGAASDQGYSIQQTRDGGCIIAGMTESFGAGLSDFYLIRLASSALLNVALTPHNPPIRIPVGGGTLTFDAEIHNADSVVWTFDGWTEVIIPSGAVIGPLVLRTGIPIVPGQTVMRIVTQTVPGNAPSGNYTYIGKAGSYPDSVVSYDTFDFVKLAGDAASKYRSWTVSGWFDEEANLSVSEYSLCAASPNPFNPTTTINFTLPQAGKVLLSVFDITGREVGTLANGRYDSGAHRLVFDGSGLASGIYFYKLTAEGFSDTQKMALVK